MISSWKSRVRSVVPAIARSTCASPSTSRRTAMPASCTSPRVRPARRSGRVGRRARAPRRARARGAAGRRPRAPRPGRGGRRRRARRAGRPRRRRRSRAGCSGGRGDVLRAGDRQHRRRDLGEPVADVEVARAPRRPGRSPRRRRPAARAAGRRPRSGSRSRKPGPNQRSADAGDHDRRARGADLAASGRPTARGVADPRAGAQQHGGGHAVGCVEQQLEADRAADRVAGVGERRRRARRARRAGRRRPRSTPAASSAIVNGSAGTARLWPWPGRSQATTSKASARCAARGAPQRRGRGAERRAEHQQRQLGPVPAPVSRTAVMPGTVIAFSSSEVRARSSTASTQVVGVAEVVAASRVGLPASVGHRRCSASTPSSAASSVARHPVGVRPAGPASSSVVCAAGDDGAAQPGCAGSPTRRARRRPARSSTGVGGGDVQGRRRARARPARPGGPARTRTGLALCGIVDEPPPARPRRARRSRGGDRVSTSVAIRPHASVQRTSASPSRVTGAARRCATARRRQAERAASSSASSAATRDGSPSRRARPARRSAARVPAAPPSCTGRGRAPRQVVVRRRGRRSASPPPSARTSWARRAG